MVSRQNVHFLFSYSNILLMKWIRFGPSSSSSLLVSGNMGNSHPATELEQMFPVCTDHTTPAFQFHPVVPDQPCNSLKKWCSSIACIALKTQNSDRGFDCQVQGRDNLDGLLFLPPAYVVRREGNVLTRVCPSIHLSDHRRGGYPYPIMLCNITQNAMGQTPRGGGGTHIP